MRGWWAEVKGVLEGFAYVLGAVMLAIIIMPVIVSFAGWWWRLWL